MLAADCSVAQGKDGRTWQGGMSLWSPLAQYHFIMSERSLPSCVCAPERFAAELQARESGVGRGERRRWLTAAAAGFGAFAPALAMEDPGRLLIAPLPDDLPVFLPRAFPGSCAFTRASSTSTSRRRRIMSECTALQAESSLLYRAPADAKGLAKTGTSDSCVAGRG